MKQITTPDSCLDVIKHYPKYFTFDIEAWFSEKKNYALMSGENVGFAEWKSPGVYWIHFCFHTARGREAVRLAKMMVDDLFETQPAKTAIGVIEVDNKRAKWVVRQMGMVSIGLEETDNGLCELFYLTKET